MKWRRSRTRRRNRTRRRSKPEISMSLSFGFEKQLARGEFLKLHVCVHNELCW